MKASGLIVLTGVVLGSESMVGASGGLAQRAEATQKEERPAVEVSSEQGVQYASPRTAMFRSDRATEKIGVAFALALERVTDVPRCGRLFEELGADGVELLTRTLYTPAHLLDEQSLCRSAAAFTWVGSVHTRICRRFSSLSDERAAMTLIHEALHQAGLTEKPMDPDGMSAGEIDNMVGDACGRKSLKQNATGNPRRAGSRGPRPAP